MICGEELLGSFFIVTHAYLWETRVYHQVSSVIKNLVYVSDNAGVVPS